MYRRAVIGRACRKFFLGNSSVRPVSLLPLYFDLWNFNCRVKGNNWCSLLPVLDVNYTLMPLWLLISLFKNVPFFAGVKGSRSYIPPHPQLLPPSSPPLPPPFWSEWEVTSSLEIFVGSQQDWQKEAGSRWFCRGKEGSNICMESYIYYKQDHLPTLINVIKENTVKWNKYVQVTVNSCIIFVSVVPWPFSLKLLVNDVTINTWLLICFPRQEIIEQLLSNIFHKDKNESAIVSAIQILLTLLETRRPT